MEKKPNGFWRDFANVEAAIRPVIAELGRMPTSQELTDRGLSGLLNGIRLHGKLPEVARRLGVPDSTGEFPKGHWVDLANVKAVLAPIIQELGRMPTQAEVTERKLWSANAAIVRHHGGYRVLAARLGLSMSKDRKERGHWKDFANVEKTLAPIIADLGRMPTEQEIKDRRLGAMSLAISKFHGGRAAVEARLGAASGSSRMPNGHWLEFANVDVVLRPIASALGRMPTQQELKDRGLSHVADAINRNHDGFLAVAKRLGVAATRLVTPMEFWDDFSNVEATLRPVVNELGRMPTQQELRDRKLSSVVHAITRHGGPSSVAARLGISTDGVQKSGGHWKEFAVVETALAPVVKELGRMPSRQELIDRKLGPVVDAITRFHDGLIAVAVRLGLPADTERRKKGYWMIFANVDEALRPVVAELGRMPTYLEMLDRGLRRAGKAITSHHGGLPAVATRLGLDPVTQQAIEERADKVARAYLALDLDDDGPLWEAMARRWLVRDLDAALAAFEKDGTLDAFRKLLDG